MSLSIDRQAFIDIVAQGKGEIGGVLQSPPGGLWGLLPDQLKVRVLRNQQDRRGVTQPSSSPRPRR